VPGGVIQGWREYWVLRLMLGSEMGRRMGKERGLGRGNEVVLV
jgi:hypothetical protein